MKKKIILIISLFLLFSITFSAVSANDIDNTTIANNDNNLIIEKEPLLGNSDVKTLTELQTELRNVGEGETITLSSNYEYSTGDPTGGIGISKAITIDGNGYTINGKNSARLFYIGSNNVVIKNLNFMNGNGGGQSGGAIFIRGDSCTIDNCNFTSNNVAYYGGAIYLDASKGTITNSQFKSNIASASGGAIYLTDKSTDTNISNSKFINNTATTNGAGIVWLSPTGILTNNEFINNKAGSGSAVFWTSNNGKITNNKFTENTASATGGALLIRGEKTTLDKNNFTSNTATDIGGAVYWDATQGTITNNNFIKSKSTTKSGGAIYISEKSTNAIIANNKFNNNSAKTTGAGIGSAGPSATITDNQFSNNWAGESGAALYCSGAKTNIKNNTFIENTVDRSGAAVYVETDGITFDSNILTDNSCLTGGAMRLNGNDGTITNNAFENNKATEGGGALFCNGNGNTLCNNNFTHNTAQNAAGGALLYNGNNYNINSNIFLKNIAGGYGGAIYGEGSNNKLNENKFIENSANRGGGALYFDGKDGSAIKNTFTDNSAENACGIRWNGDGATVTENTFSGNTNKNGQNIIYGDGAKASVTKNTFINNKESDNCIRWNSADAVIKDNVYQEKAKTTSLTLADVTVYYGETGKLIATLKDSENKVVSGKSVSITFNNKQTAANTNAQGQVSIDIKDLNAETYSASAKFDGDSQYEASNATATVTVNKAPTEIVLTDVKDIIFGQEIAITATVNATGGSVTFIIDGENTTLPLTSAGKAIKLFKPTLGDHTYNVTAVYNPSANYLGSSVSATFKTTKKPTTLTGENVTAYLGGKGQLIFTLTDDESKALGLRELTVNFNGQKYNQRTDSEGKIIIDLANLGIGTYSATVSYNGSEIYAPSNATAIAFVKSTIESEDLTANYGDAKYSAKFTDVNGKALAKGTVVTFTIGNDRYDVKVGDNGIATLDVNKTPGKYVITNINPMTGEATTNNITINKMPTETIISGVKDIYVGENLTAKVNVNATGELTITLNNETQIENYTGGDFRLDFNNLAEGDYTVTVIFKPANEYYIGSTANATFAVSKRANELTVNAKDIDEGQDAVFDVMTTAQTGNVTLNIAGKSYTQNLTNGKATFTVSNLTADTYKYTISTPGDDYYEGNTTQGTINVKSTTLIIDAPDLTKYYSGPERFVINVTDKDGKPAVGITLTVIINGEKYERTIRETGVTTFAIGLRPGTYDALIIFKGNDDFSPVNKTSQIVVKTTIYGENLNKIEKAPEQYIATFTDSSGKVLTDGKATFNIHGVFYDRAINAAGQAKLNINLGVGEYIITAINPVTKEESSNIIKVNTRFANHGNVTKLYRNDTQYYITLLGDDGKAVGAGQNVTFNINGVMYVRTTNENGTAKLNINLNPGDYIITAIYKGCMVSDTITVLPIIIADNIVMSYKDGTQFKAKLLDGQGNPYVNQTITFNINGLFYERKTDSEGIAKLNINLMAGEYIITSYYGTFATSNKITIRP